MKYEKIKIDTRALILAILLYTFITNTSDVRKGFVKGWNTANMNYQVKTT